MSRLLARIMLALLMLPLAALLYGVVIVVLMTWFWRNEDGNFLLADMATAAFVVVYWTLLWRGTVRWTHRRKALTGAAGAVGIGAGGILGGLFATIELSFGIFIGGIAAILIWLFVTVLVWRETPEERRRRVAGVGGAHPIVCPACGYNLTGLRESSCPECGARYSLDELYAMQPEREADEVAKEG